MKTDGFGVTILAAWTKPSRSAGAVTLPCGAVTHCRSQQAMASVMAVFTKPARALALVSLI